MGYPTELSQSNRCNRPPMSSTLCPHGRNTAWDMGSWHCIRGTVLVNRAPMCEQWEEWEMCSSDKPTNAQASSVTAWSIGECKAATHSSMQICKMPQRSMHGTAVSEEEGCERQCS